MPWWRIGTHYARGAIVAADGDDPKAADVAFAAARADHLERWPLARARLSRAYGSWLRRQRRVAESRAALRSARDVLDAIGVHYLADRARQELDASGETSRHRGIDALDQLTPQELQIVRLAADGLSNREDRRAALLSHRTVSSHLYRAFPKLGITSRLQLAPRAALTGRSASPRRPATRDRDDCSHGCSHLTEARGHRSGIASWPSHRLVADRSGGPVRDRSKEAHTMLTTLAAQNWGLFIVPRDRRAALRGIRVPRARPGQLPALIFVFASYAIVDGVLAVVVGLGTPGGPRWLLVAGGILVVGIGIYTGFNPSVTATALVIRSVPSSSSEALPSCPQPSPCGRWCRTRG